MLRRMRDRLSGWPAASMSGRRARRSGGRALLGSFGVTSNSYVFMACIIWSCPSDGQGAQWAEIDRLLAISHAIPCSHSSARHEICCGPDQKQPSKSASTYVWSDMWRVYEDVCVMCAGLLMGGLWRGAHGGRVQAGGGFGARAE